MSPGERLRYWRQENNLKAAEVATKIGITESGLTRFETGKTQITIKYLSALNDIYGLSIDWLITGQGDPVPQKSGPPILDQYEQLNTENKKVVDRTIAALLLSQAKDSEAEKLSSSRAG